MAINLREALRGIEERVEIVAFVLRGTPAETITLATEDIAAFPEVQDVTFVTEEQALARARTELVEFRDAYRDLQVNPLPASIEVRMQRGLPRERQRGSGWPSGCAASASWTTSATAATGCSGWTSSATSPAWSAW